MKKLLVFAFALLAACQPTGKVQKSKYELLGEGKVLSVMNNRLLVRTDDDLLRAPLDDSSAAILSQLRKGEKVALYGTSENPAKNKKFTRATVYDVQRENGTLIQLTQ